MTDEEIERFIRHQHSWHVDTVTGKLQVNKPSWDEGVGWKKDLSLYYDIDNFNSPMAVFNYYLSKNNKVFLGLYNRTHTRKLVIGDGRKYAPYFNEEGYHALMDYCENVKNMISVKAYGISRQELEAIFELFLENNGYFLP